MASFEGFEPVFGEVIPERSDPPGPGLLRRCLFHVYASDSFHLTFHVTDFISGAWEKILSVSQLDDMRDTVGVGGSWFEFLEYTVASLRSDNVKLLLGDHKGVESARLVSQKAKGMPRVVITLAKMVDESSGSQAMATLSFELFRALKRNEQLQGETSNSAAAINEKDKRESSHNQLEQYSGKLDVMAPSIDNRQDSPAKQSKPSKRVPAHRRTRKRGALLQDSDEEDG